MPYKSFRTFLFALLCFHCLQILSLTCTDDEKEPAADAELDADELVADEAEDRGELQLALRDNILRC